MTTSFPELNHLLSDLTHAVQKVFGDDFAALYLRGSFATGGADEDSDVDFLVAVRRAPNAVRVWLLNRLHEDFNDRPGYWSKHLEGSYAPLDALRRFRPDGPPWHYLDNGSRNLILDRNDDCNVVRWSLLRHGITLSGPPPGELIDPVSTDELKREIATDIHDWGERLTSEPARLDNAWLQLFVVVSYCRMLHSLATGRIESKQAGVKWALTALDPHWHIQIREAWAWRKGQYARYGTPVGAAAVARTIDFIAHARSLTPGDA